MWNDLRFALRMFRRSPGFTAAVIATLAIGIGANTAIFTVVRGVLLRPLRYSQPERLVQIWETLPSGGTGAIAPPNLRDWRAQNHSLEYLVAYSRQSLTLQNVDTPERILTVGAEAGLFAMLGVQPILGRTFASDEDAPGRPPVAVMSEALWKRSFGADPSTVAKT